jgi:hypothetical protein
LGHKIPFLVSQSRSGEDVAQDQMLKEIDESKGKAMAAEVQSAVEQGMEFYDPTTGKGFKAEASDIAPASEEAIGLFNRLNSLVEPVDIDQLIANVSEGGKCYGTITNFIPSRSIRGRYDPND